VARVHSCASAAPGEAMREVLDHREGDGDKNNAQRGGKRHSADHNGAQDTAGSCARAGGGPERQAANDERQCGHNNWDIGGKTPHVRYYTGNGSVRDEPSREEPVHPGVWKVQWMKPEPMHSIEVVDNPRSAGVSQGPPLLRIEIKSTNEPTYFQESVAPPTYHLAIQINGNVALFVGVRSLPLDCASAESGPSWGPSLTTPRMSQASAASREIQIEFGLGLQPPTAIAAGRT